MIIEEVMNYNFPEYKVERFKKYLKKDVYKSKAARTVQEDYIGVYTSYKNRLVLRIFFLKQYYYKKKLCRSLYEIQRRVSGESKACSCRLYPSFTGVRVYEGEDERGWFIHSNKTYRVDKFNSYGYTCYESIEYLNSPVTFMKRQYPYNSYEYYLKDNNRLDAFEYLKLYKKHPQVEMIVKMGLGYLLHDLKTNKMNWKESGYKVLGLEKQDIPLIRGIKLNLYYYNIHKDNIRKYNINNENRYKALVELIALSDESNMNFVTNKYIDYLEVRDAINYRDYINICSRLGIVLTSQVRFPIDLEQAHDEVSNKEDSIKNKESNIKIFDHYRNILKYTYSESDYVILPVENAGQLINESKVLGHCVKTYVDKVAEGKTNIFFIRKIDDVTTPYVTLELANNHIRQCRAEHNDRPNNEVVNFVNHWANKFNLKSCFS